MNCVYPPDLGLPEPASPDRLSLHELGGCFPWDLLARLAPDYEAARRQYYRDNRALRGRLGRCPRKARGFKECVAGLFRGLFLAGGSPAEELAALEEEENPCGAGAKGIPFLPQRKAWLLAPFCGFAPKGAAVARMLRLRRDLLALRKSLFHEREILAKVCRKDCPFIPEKALFQYRDIYDHLTTFFELTETDRDTVGGI